jgi:L-amino acid N-acyltransferase YncA
LNEAIRLTFALNRRCWILALQPNDMTIRDCVAGDLAAITAIYRYAVLSGTGTFEIDPPDETEMAARHARLTGQGYPFLVACAAGEVLGYAYAGPYRERAAYRFLVEDSIYVREDCQGRGAGSALIERLIEECVARGFRQMVAVIGDSENIGSIRLHAKAGFVASGTLTAAGWKAGRWLDVVLMQRALGSGASEPPST